MFVNVSKENFVCNGVVGPLSPYNSDVRVFFNDLLEGREVDASETADFIGAMFASEQSAYAENGVYAGVETVMPRRISKIYWIPF